MKTTLRRRWSAVAVLLAPLAAAAALLPATASADPANGYSYTFSNCVGPPGTPTTFEATLPLGGSAGRLYLLPGGTSAFVAVSWLNVGTGASFTVPGSTVNGIPTITCDLFSPFTGARYIYSGFFTPVR